LINGSVAGVDYIAGNRSANQLRMKEWRCGDPCDENQNKACMN
jgi:hypothetical protein